jgi:hypothetical protein
MVRFILLSIICLVLLDTPENTESTAIDNSTDIGKSKGKWFSVTTKAEEKDEKFKEPPYTFLEPDHPQLIQTMFVYLALYRH